MTMNKALTPDDLYRARLNEEHIDQGIEAVNALLLESARHRSPPHTISNTWCKGLTYGEQIAVLEQFASSWSIKGGDSQRDGPWWVFKPKASSTVWIGNER